MAVSEFMKSSGLTALAAALAMLALPASAQDRGQGRWGGRGGAEATAQGGGGNWRGGDRARSSPSARTPRPQAQSQGQAQGQRGWSRGDAGASRGEERGGGWRGRGGDAGQAQAPFRAVPQASARNQAERRSWRDRSGNQRNDNRRPGNWQGGDRNYAEAARIRQDAARARAGNDNRWRNQRETFNRGNNAWNNNAWNNNNWNNNNGWRGNRHGYAQRWDRNWRRDNRFDWRGYRSANRGIYRMRPYYAPIRNYNYRRLSAGFQLNALFFGSQYLINDPWQYRLPPADGPFRWVRYYDDALLVDTYSGEVVDVIYDFFW